MYKATIVHHRQCGREVVLGTGTTILVLPVFAINFKQITYRFTVSKEILIPFTSKRGSENKWKDTRILKQISKYI